MQLYATVTGDRIIDGVPKAVKKGQGGTNQLNIDISVDGNERPRFKLFINVREDASTDIVLVDMEKPYPNEVFRDKTKGKK